MLTILTQKELPEPYRSYHPKTLRRKIAAGEFPPPVRIGDFEGWIELLVDQHMVSMVRSVKRKSRCPQWSPEFARAAINKRWTAERARRRAECEAEASA